MMRIGLPRAATLAVSALQAAAGVQSSASSTKISKGHTDGKMQPLWHERCSSDKKHWPLHRPVGVVWPLLPLRAHCYHREPNPTARCACGLNLAALSVDQGRIRVTHTVTLLEIKFV